MRARRTPAREQAAVCLHYLINRLQPLPWQQPVLVSLNPDPARPVDPARVIGEYEYSHPVFDLAAIRAQQRLPELQGRSHLWFCGAWARYGFHEDGLGSALDVVQRLRAQWRQQGDCARRHEPDSHRRTHAPARHRHGAPPPAAPDRACLRLPDLLPDAADAVACGRRRAARCDATASACMSFHDRDHGDGRADALAWLDELLAAEGVHDADGEVWLHTYPRVLGYVFKPVSFWYCHRSDGSLAAVVAEVNNTFGERHCYLLDGPELAFGRELTARKVFHVSPFCQVQGQYRFRFMRTAERTVARVDHDDDAGALLQTSVSGQLQPLTRHACAPPSSACR